MRLLRNFFRRVRGLVRAETIHREIDEEARFHIEMCIDENIRRGMSPEAARQDAERRFGNLTRMKERGYEVRGGRWLEPLWQDIRYSVRMLYKSPGVTIIILATLALGIGANTAIFSVVNSVLLRPLPYRDTEKLMYIVETQLPQFPAITASPGNFLEWEKRNTVFEKIFAVRYVDQILTGVGDPEKLNAEKVSAGYLSMLSSFRLGRDFTAEEDQFGHSNVCILSYKLWQKRFSGNPNIIGKPVTLDNQIFSIIGIMTEDFRPPFSASTELWIPMAFTPEEQQKKNYHDIPAVVGKLKPGVTIEQAQKEMSLMADQIAKEYPENKRYNIRIESLLDAKVGDIKKSLYVMLVTVGLVLLIVCANISNLLLARATSRHKEIAIRLTLGAGRIHIIRQLLTETIMLSTIGSILGALVAFFGVKLLLELSPENLLRMDSVSIGGRALIFTAVVTLLTGLIIGLVPALQCSMPNLNETLKDTSRGSTEAGNRRIIRNVLVVFEIAMSLVILISAGLLMKSFLGLHRVDPGFNASNISIFAFTLPKTKYPLKSQQATFYKQLIETVSSLPGVKSAAVSQNIPMMHAYLPYFYIKGQPRPENALRPNTHYYAVSPDYFKTMGIPLVRGRAFTDSDNADTAGVAVISESMAKKYFPNEDPIGKYITVTMGPETFREIVGIVGNVKPDIVKEDTKPQTYEPYLQNPFSDMSLIVKVNGNPVGLVDGVLNTLKSIDRNQPISTISNYEQVLRDSLVQQRFSMNLMGIFAAFAVLIAAIGIYGVLSYSVGQRVYELGIRMALGAERHDIFKLIITDGLLLAVIGIVIGMGGAYFATRYIESMLFHITRTDPMIFISLPFIVLIVALIACYFPAQRAANVDPIISLRE